MNKDEFLKKFNIAEEDFKKTDLKWEDLLDIREDYKSIIKNLKTVAGYIVESLYKAANVHSIKYRIKDPDKLMEKIVRKVMETPSRKISKKNYRREVTDLIGIRVLHLFKNEWKNIGDFIKDNWNLYETPIIYMRKGDPSEYYEKEKAETTYKIEVHKNDYRSIHYLVKTIPYKEEYIAEIQTRTIFEEAWGEIDHKVRYPEHRNEILINQFLTIFNKLAGSADEMGLYVMNLKKELITREESFEEKIRKLKDEIEKLNLKQEDSKTIVTGLDDLSSGFTINATSSDNFSIGNSHTTSWASPYSTSFHLGTKTDSSKGLFTTGDGITSFAKTDNVDD